MSNQIVKSYAETLEYLFAQLPVFESQGAHAYKPGLERCEEMDERLGHPHRAFKTIHVAGTNGKGSTSHLLASVLQSAGYKVGLFTSPHLVDFSERIRVNGEPIAQDYVVEWTAKWCQTGDNDNLLDLQPSFFELATMMAFCYFKDQKVDVAIIEVGLGGRLDSTNIITPLLSIITNISLDHTQFLGDTLPQIAAEKAGIMKRGIPCVIGECTDERVRFTFGQNAQLHEVERLDFACDRKQVMWVQTKTDASGTYNIYTTLDDGELICPLTGKCQPHNANTVITAVHQLQRLHDEGVSPFVITREAMAEGFSNVLTQTHLRGRWEITDTYPDGSPRVICDTGHNEGCFQYLGPAMQQIVDSGKDLHVVFGMVADKDVNTVLTYLPKGAHYHWCNAPTPRALQASDLAGMAARCGLKGEVHGSISEAYQAATDAISSDNGTVFVGGSNFIVCEILKNEADK